MKQERLLLGYQTYDFITDDGEKVEGASAYLLSDEINSENAAGYKTMKISLTKKMISKIYGKKLPAIVDCKFELSSNSNQQPTLKIVDFDYVRPSKFDFEEVKK